MSPHASKRRPRAHHGGAGRAAASALSPPPPPPPRFVSLLAVPRSVSPGRPPWLLHTAPSTSSSLDDTASTGGHVFDDGGWADAPPDVLRLVVSRLAPHDVQTALLVCRDWRAGFAAGLLSLRPRLLRVDRLVDG